MAPLRLTRHIARLVSIPGTVVFLLLVVGPCAAQSTTQQTADGDLMARIEAAREQLRLDDEQLEQVRSILQDSAARMRGVIEENHVQSGEKMGLGRKIKIGRKLKAVQKETDKELAGVLDKPQMKEFKAIRKQYQKQMREQMKANQAG